MWSEFAPAWGNQIAKARRASLGPAGLVKKDENNATATRSPAHSAATICQGAIPRGFAGARLASRKRFQPRFSARARIAAARFNTKVSLVAASKPKPAPASKPQAI